ncbi:MAG: carbohydrate kinase family protein [Sphaerochaetaceae bacterium]
MIGFLGESLIDFISGTGENDEPLFHYYCGGCALNAATAASRLNGEVTYIGKLSKDMFGQQMKNYFIDNNVSLIENLCDVDENSMIGFTKIDESGAASYVFYTERTTVNALTTDEILDALGSVKDLRYLHVGSVSVALDKSGETILDALRSCRTLPFVFFDPNVRPTVIEDFESYRKRVLSVASLSTMIKLSDEDLQLLFPSMTQQQAVARLLRDTTSHLLLTMGKDGLRWISQSGMDIRVDAIDNPIVDTVGAGDTVSGAVLTYLSENEITSSTEISEQTARKIMDFAVRCAAVTTSRKGANPPRRDEI